jgi:Zn-dependent peptidase ImmA (M78 family)
MVKKMPKVSYRKSKTIENKANEILLQAQKLGFYDSKSFTPIDLIVEKIFKLQIKFANLNQDFAGVLGAIDFINSVIWIDNSLNYIEPYNSIDEARCNFTIAHEIGHYVFHKKIYEQSEDVALFHDENNPKTKMIETQANMFAAYILMPEKLIKIKWSEITNKLKSSAQKIAPETSHFFTWNQIDDDEQTEEIKQRVISEMAKFFKVSKEAITNRIKIVDC